LIKTIGKTETAGRKSWLTRIKSRSVAFDRELLVNVADIIADVQQRGDAALLAYTERFDGIRLRQDQLRIAPDALRQCAQGVDSFVLESLREAIRNVRYFHERQREESWRYSPGPGVELGQRITALERVGLYVPGGTAAYPSSVVMNAVPAQVAGVGRLVVATPPRALAENPVVAAALLELNVTEVYGIGGAHAIAALAFGTETVPRVDKITGPGNQYVAAAKKLVFGAVGIDSIAGPTEVVIVADESARGEFIAADLLAQAEHAADASAVLITTSEALATAVAAELARQLPLLARRSVIEKSLADYGAIFVVTDLTEAAAIVNELAPEHLEITTVDDELVAQSIQHAGAVFFGAYTPEAVGDYFAGPNHVLPTGGTARFSSALGVYDFIKRTSVLRYSAAALGQSASKIAALAGAEGLDAHARSILIRTEPGKERA
jgi:histidinol dehydrogenase